MKITRVTKLVAMIVVLIKIMAIFDFLLMEKLQKTFLIGFLIKTFFIQRQEILDIALMAYIGLRSINEIEHRSFNRNTPDTLVFLLWVLGSLKV